MVTGGGQPGPFGINTAISRLQRAAAWVDHEARPAAAPLPDPCRTHWIRAFTALERLVPGFMASGRHYWEPLRRTRALDPGPLR